MNPCRDIIVVLFGRILGVVLSMLMPGLGVYMAGKRWRGLAWCFSLHVLGCVCLIVSSMLPSVYLFLVAALTFSIFYTAMLIDSMRPPLKHSALVWLATLAVSLTLACIWTFIVAKYAPISVTVSSECMAPTLCTRDKERIIIDVCTYRFFDPQRGDIVLVRTAITNFNPALKHAVFVKRIVGLPGECVTISDPYVYINGVRLLVPEIFRKISEDSVYGGYRSTIFIKSGQAAAKTLITGPSEYYLLGDNSLESFDSRYFGAINRRDILGRAMFVVWPLHRIRTLE